MDRFSIIKDIIEEELKKYVMERCNRKVEGEQLYLVNRDVDKVQVSLSILDV